MIRPMLSAPLSVPIGHLILRHVTFGDIFEILCRQHHYDLPQES